MSRSAPDQDVRSISDLGINLVRLVRRVRRTKRPMVLTSRGGDAAVLVDAREYAQLVEEVETLRDIHSAEKQLARGRGLSQSKAKDRVLAALRK